MTFRPIRSCNIAADDLRLREMLADILDHFDLKQRIAVSNIDHDTIRTRRENSPTWEPNPVQNVASRYNPQSGRVSLVFDGPDGARMFNVYRRTSNNPFTWELIGTTTKQKYNSDGNIPGSILWFAITAVGTAGESSKSEPARAMAA